MTSHRAITRKLRVLNVVVAVALVALATIVPASAARARPVGSRPAPRGYVALGDSIPFGYSPLLEDPWIASRFIGYPEEIGRRTGVATTNLACPGQTARALISLTAPDSGCFDARRQFARDGVEMLHTKYAGTQLSAALKAVRSETPPRWITIQGGGNEVSTCVEDNQDSKSAGMKCLDGVLPKVTSALSQASARLRGAGYRGRVALVGYYLVPGLEAPIRRLNRAIERSAHDQGVAYVDTADPFDHYARRHGGDLCEAGLLIATPDGGCDLHPTPAGRNLLATAVLGSLTR